MAPVTLQPMPDIEDLSELATRMRDLRQQLHTDHTSVVYSCIDSMSNLVKDYANELRKQEFSTPTLKDHTAQHELFSQVHELHDRAVAASVQKTNTISDWNALAAQYFIGIREGFRPTVYENKEAHLNRLICQHLSREGHCDISRAFSEAANVKDFDSITKIGALSTMDEIAAEIRAKNLTMLIGWIVLNSAALKLVDRRFEFDVRKIVYVQMMSRLQWIAEPKLRHEMVIETLAYAKRHLVPLQDDPREIERICCAILYCGRRIGPKLIGKEISVPREQSDQDESCGLKESQNNTGHGIPSTLDGIGGLAHDISQPFSSLNASASTGSKSKSKSKKSKSESDSGSESESESETGRETKKATKAVQPSQDAFDNFAPQKYAEIHREMTDSDWDELSLRFGRAYCNVNGVSPESSLFATVRAGTIGLPLIADSMSLLPESNSHWESAVELHVEVPMCVQQRYHSVFACPVAREQGTRTNPPMMLPCGHSVCKAAVARLERPGSIAIKCPYCPMETDPAKAMRIFY